MTFATRMLAEIAAAPMSVATFMTRSNAHYYATRDPFGQGGDFVTAPEISQMFGELVGAWLADRWRAAGSPAAARLIELGPGRGAMMADMLRSSAAAGWSPQVALVETSPILRAAQTRAVPDATWHDDLATVAEDGPAFIVANEFFDALPVRQFERAVDGWRERMVAANDGRDLGLALGPVAIAPPIPAAHAAAPPGTVVEVSPVATAIAAEIGHRLRDHGGAALIIDYGHAGATGDTLQAVRGHARADPFADPGGADLTCHVDFAALAAAAAAGGGVRAWGPVGQGDFLRALGLDARATALRQRATPAQAAAIDAAVARLTGDAAMGHLFRVVALTRDDVSTAPPGFA